MITNPTPQRALRAHRPHRPSLRVINSAEHQAWLASHLTPRDRWLIRMISEHKVLTVHQIVDLCFPTRRAANLRLLNLHRWGILHRFQPHRDRGSHPMHYVLDSAGATLLAHEDGIDPRTLNYSRDRELGRAHSLQLAHTVGCNSLFTRLVHRSRQPGTTGELTLWWSAHRCRRHWGDIVTPDGYGRWHEGVRDIEWFTEFDFGTERLARLGGKLTRYEHLARATGITTPVLFWLPTTAREATARRILTDTLRTLDHPQRVPVATTHGQIADDPVDLALPRWQRLGDTHPSGRVPLTELSALWPTLHAPTRSSHPHRSLDIANARPEPAPPAPIPPEPSQRAR